eukprot:11048121-Alexandrium_andersonii.AAC.1
MAPGEPLALVDLVREVGDRDPATAAVDDGVGPVAQQVHADQDGHVRVDHGDRDLGLARGQ